MALRARLLAAWVLGAGSSGCDRLHATTEDAGGIFPEASLTAAPSSSVAGSQEVQLSRRRLNVAPSTEGGFFLLGGRTVQSVGTDTPFRPVELTPGELLARVQDIPELEVLGTDVKLSDKYDLDYRVLRLKPMPKGSNLTVQPVLWSPEPGVEFLLVGVRSRSATFLSVFHSYQARAERQLAAHMLFANESIPIGFSFDAAVPTEVKWTACWKCRGEEGVVQYTPDKRVVVRQR